MRAELASMMDVTAGNLRTGDVARLRTTHPDGGKVTQAARQFEAILVSQWMEKAHQAFASVPGGEEEQGGDPGKDQFYSLAFQSLAQKLTDAGGFGISRILAKDLLSHDLQGQPSDLAPSPNADPRK